MAILLTGGTGKTASRIAKLLQQRNIAVLVASRKGQAGVPAGFTGVQFDFHDQSTWQNPFSTGQAINTVYLVGPQQDPADESAERTKKFIDFAKERGVRRFLLLSASIIEKGGVAHGQVHAYLEEIGVDYAVIRPSWFFGVFPTILLVICLI
jgi:festuclavine dehydrogenase